MSKSPTVFIATELIKQIEDESPQSLMWLLSAMNRFLLLNPTMSLLEFKRIIHETAPDSSDLFKLITELKGLKTVD